MYQSNHAKAGRALATAVLLGIQPGVEHEQWFVPVQYPTQESDHFLLSLLLVTRVVRPARVVAFVLLCSASRLPVTALGLQDVLFTVS